MGIAMSRVCYIVSLSFIKDGVLPPAQKSLREMISATSCSAVSIMTEDQTEASQCGRVLLNKIKSKIRPTIKRKKILKLY